MSYKLSLKYVGVLALIIAAESMATGKAAQANNEEIEVNPEDLQKAIEILVENNVLETDPVTNETRVNQSIIQILQEKRILQQKMAAGGNDCGIGGWSR